MWRIVNRVSDFWLHVSLKKNRSSEAAILCLLLSKNYKIGISRAISMPSPSTLPTMVNGLVFRIITWQPHRDSSPYPATVYALRSSCSIFSFMSMFFRSLFVPLSFFFLAIVVSVLRFTDSDYPFGIFKRFLSLISFHQYPLKYYTCISIYTNTYSSHVVHVIAVGVIIVQNKSAWAALGNWAPRTVTSTDWNYCTCMSIYTHLFIVCCSCHCCRCNNCSEQERWAALSD